MNEPFKLAQSGKTIAERQEEARSKLALNLLRYSCFIIAGTIIIGALLLYSLPKDKFSFTEMLNLVLAVSSIFSGLLGASITYYFSHK